ncbi:MAG: ArsR family transcriptional regulator [Thaumarchaeota archaeon]|nr:MAG: ArsR family transcriptional regulator [Nitrososphaerota archaeon]
MVRGYKVEKIKEKLIDVLRDSKTGLSGIEIAEKLKINRLTITKYLQVFAAEGLVKQKNIGNVNLWFIEEGVESFEFPADFFRVKNKYLQYVLLGVSREAHNILRNSLHSGANPTKIITEVIIPSIESVQNSYNTGKIGKSEKNYLDDIILGSIYLITLTERETNLKKNVIIFSTDSNNSLMAQAASAAFHVEGWKISQLGDMSTAIDVMFDIDLQRFLNKIWTKKQGLMVIVVFSSTESTIKFFSQAIVASKAKFGKALHLVFCTKLTKKTKEETDFVSDDIEKILQWCQTVYESMQS